MRRRVCRWGGRILLLALLLALPIPHLPLLGVCALSLELGEAAGGGLGLTLGLLTLLGSAPGCWWLPAVYALGGFLSGAGEPRLGLRSRCLSFALGGVSGLLLLELAVLLPLWVGGESFPQGAASALREGGIALAAGTGVFGLIALAGRVHSKKRDDGMDLM